jgi:ribosomal protein L11 methylase PrmA
MNSNEVVDVDDKGEVAYPSKDTTNGSNVSEEVPNVNPTSEQQQQQQHGGREYIGNQNNSATTTALCGDEKMKQYHHRPSPVAQAFFAALDMVEQQQDRQVYASGQQQQPPKEKLMSQKSKLIQKQIQTLGWRNRYSQHDLYPLTINRRTYPPTSTSASNALITPTTFHVRQVQRGEIDATYGTGATVWPASIVLMKYLQRHASQWFPMHKNDEDHHDHHHHHHHHRPMVLDLGTGTGVTSIAAALLGAKHVICTDGDANVVRLAQSNIHNAAVEIESSLRNRTDSAAVITPPTAPIRSGDITENVVGPGLQTIHCNDGDDTNTVAYINNCAIEVQQYWWGTGTLQSQVIKSSSMNTSCVDHSDTTGDSIMKLEGCFDVILVSDCVLPKLYPIEPLIDAINLMLGRRRRHNSDPKPVAIIAYEYRYYDQYDPKQYVIELCKQKQLQLIVVPPSEHDAIYSIPDDIEIWHIYRE